MKSGSTLPSATKATRTKLFGHTKLVGAFGATQLLVQGTGMLSGILIVRFLSPHEYGLYTLSLTLLGTMSVLADAGISSGVMAEGGKVWQDRTRLGEVLATGIALRRQFAIYSLLLILPLLTYMLLSHGATWHQVAAISVGVLLTFITSLSDTILEIVPKLHQQLLPLSKIQSLQSAGRLGLIAIGPRLIPIASVAIFAAALPQVWANQRIRKLTHEFADKNCGPSAEVRSRILRLVRRTLPGAIFFCVSGQITLWLIAFFGSSTAIAEVGALGRISQVAALYSVMVASILVPRFARLPCNRAILRKWFWAILGMTLAFGGGIVAIAAIWTSPLLWLLGSNYAGLKTELILSLAGTAVGLANGLTYSLGNCRGWIMNPAIAIPLVVLGQLIVAPLVNFGSVQGIMTFALLGGIIPLLTRVGYIVIMINQTSAESTNA